MLIAFTHIIVIDIKVCLFGDCHAGMTQDFTQGVNIHSIHQATLGKVVPQTMGCVFFIQPRTGNVLPKIAFKIADTDGTAVFLYGELICAFHLAVCVLEPTPQSLFGLGGEKYSSFFPPFGFLRPQIYPLAGKF